MTWQHDEIRAARQKHLKPVCEELGYRLEHVRDGNYRVDGLPGEIIIKDNYWICIDNSAAGNAIDFLVHIEGMPFRKAIQLLMKDAQDR